MLSVRTYYILACTWCYIASVENGCYLAFLPPAGVWWVGTGWGLVVDTSRVIHELRIVLALFSVFIWNKGREMAKQLLRPTKMLIRVGGRGAAT